MAGIKIDHTPKPWGETELYDDDGVWIGSNIGNIELDRRVCFVGGSFDDRLELQPDEHTPENRANVKLLKACPEMLDILREFVEDMEVAYSKTKSWDTIEEDWPDLFSTYLRASTLVASLSKKRRKK